MAEILPTTAIHQGEPDDPQASAYLESLGDKRTARHASEEAYNAPAYDDVTDATRKIRNDIKGVFDMASGSREYPEADLQELMDSYWQRASKVGVEHGAKPGFELKDYLTVGPERSYDEVKTSIERDFSPESIPRSVLDGIDAYRSILGINPAHAATVTTELISRGLPQIDMIASRIAQDTGCSREEAVTRAFGEFITEEVPFHINSIISRHGYGDQAVVSYFNKNSFYPPAEQDKKDVSLRMSIDDIKGLIRVYDIQSRPYSQEELDGARALAMDAAMQAAILRTQEQLVDFSARYLEQHPDRANKDLSNFSEIFVPEKTDGGLRLLPNPKLLRAMVNNILPGIAKSVIDRGATMQDLTNGDISTGVRTAAKTYRLFNVNIGQFENFDKESDTAELHSIYKVTCPANGHFPDYLMGNFADIYAAERTKH